MNKVYKVEQGNNLITTEDFIAISKKKFADYEEMKKQAEKISLKSSFTIIPKKDVHEVTFNQKGKSIKVLFSSEKDLNDKYEIIPSDIDELNEMGEEISHFFSLEKITKSENKLKYLAINSLKVIISLVITFILVNASIGMQNGETYSVSGKRTGLKQLFMNAIDFLGPIGTTIIGLAIITYYSYKMIVRFKNPSTDILLKKKIQK